jgi:HlyD family secretion protein
VATVAVKVGDTVTVGQALATLDGKTLEEALHTAEATLAQAKLTLRSALNGETVSASPGGTNSAPSGSGTELRSTRNDDDTRIVFVAAQSVDPEIAAAQQAVLAAQHDVGEKLAIAATAVSNAVTVCAAIGSDPLVTPTPEQVGACQIAVTEALDAQQDVADAQNVLADACNALDALLNTRASTPTTGEQPSPSTPSGTGAPQGSPGGSSPSSAELVAYQKAVDAAQAEVAAAEQAMAQATIASPIEGKVVAVHLDVGETVTAASTDATVVVEGAGGYEVATTISVDRVADVEVGQDASVVPDGATESLDGKVAYISTVPTASESATTYLVIIGLERSKDTALKNGSTGTATIVTEHAKSALAVPTSAVTTNGTRHTVGVVNGDGSETRSVTVGVIGDTWTEILDGLEPGDEVVLADLNQALPGSATSSSNGEQSNFPVFGGGGGFPGGGGGGFPAG